MAHGDDALERRRRSSPAAGGASRRRAITLLAGARTLDIAGAEIIFTIRAYDLYQRTDSALWLSALMVAFFGGLTLGEPIGGVLGDRFDRRKVLVWAGVLQGALLGSLIVVTDPTAVVAITFAGALAAAPYNSTLPASVPALAGADHVSWANGFVNAGMNLGLIVGPPIGGALWDVAGPGWGFATGVVFIFAAAALVAIVPGDFSTGDERSSSGRFREGIRTVSADPVLRAVTLGWIVMMAGLGVVLVAEVPLATAFGWGAMGYALLAVAWGGGAVIGSLLGRYIRAGDEPRIVIVGLVGLGVGLGVIALTQHPALVLVALAAGGLADSAGEVAAQTAVQRRTRDEVRARAMAVLNTAGIGSLALSFAIAGPMLERLGIAGAYAVSAATALLAALVVLVLLQPHLTGASSDH